MTRERPFGGVSRFGAPCLKMRGRFPGALCRNIHKYEFVLKILRSSRCLWRNTCASRTFFSWLQRDKKYQLDTNMHGEERPFVMTGQYEKVFPMDIYPVHLLKAVLIEDLELMENLGIYEVVEEDFALCEFVCTSKIESQDIIRRGLDLIRKEMS